jgi:hypothetical protein
MQCHGKTMGGQVFGDGPTKSFCGSGDQSHLRDAVLHVSYLVLSVVLRCIYGAGAIFKRGNPETLRGGCLVVIAYSVSIILENLQ